MTQRRATDKRNALERNEAEAISMLVEGATQPQVARHFGVHNSTVLRFVRRNQDLIDQRAQRVARAIEDYAVAHAANRMAGLQRLADRIEAHIEEHGLTETTEVDDGRRKTTKTRFVRDASAELRAVYEDAAKERGERQPAPVTINVDNRQVILKWDDGDRA